MTTLKNLPKYKYLSVPTIYSAYIYPRTESVIKELDRPDTITIGLCTKKDEMIERFNHAYEMLADYTSYDIGYYQDQTTKNIYLTLKPKIEFFDEDHELFDSNGTYMQLDELWGLTNKLEQLLPICILTNKPVNCKIPENTY